MLTGWRWIFVVGLVYLAGCGGSKEVYKREAFDLDSPFQLPTTVSAGVACESVRRALLGQGYIIESADASAVRAKKAFRDSPDESTVLEMNISCIERGGASTIFANAVESAFSVKKSSQSASVGVPVLGSISVPLKGSSDSMVKTGDETVNDKEFYQRFFAVVEYYLEQLTEAAPRPEAPAEAAVTPAAGPQVPALQPLPEVKGPVAPMQPIPPVERIPPASPGPADSVPVPTPSEGAPARRPVPI